MRDDDFKWFVENYDNLYQKYGHKFIAIKDKQVLGAYDSVIEAIDVTAQKYSVGTFIVQECNGDSSAYTASITTFGIIK